MTDDTWTCEDCFECPFLAAEMKRNRDDDYTRQCVYYDMPVLIYYNRMEDECSVELEYCKVTGVIVQKQED